MRIIIGLLMLLSINANANVAVDQINEILSNHANHRDEIKTEFRDYYLIYVFKSTCPHCQKFSPLIHDFSEHTGIKLKAYSIDGATIGTLKSTPISPYLFDALFTSAGFRPVVPALFLVNKDTNQAYAVSFGETSAVDLVSRLEELTKKIKEKFDA